MAKIKKNKKNFLIIEMSMFEALGIWSEFDGVGMCDTCNDIPEKGFYVAVLNRYICPHCFAEWVKKAKNYKDDRSFEKIHFDDTVHRLKTLDLWEE